MKINFKHLIQIRVRYGETDQMGYCYYGNYAQYLEVARVESLRELGVSYKELEDRGVMLPVSEFSISYKYPAKYDDLLTIECVITELAGARILFDYTIQNEQNRLVATAKTTLVIVAKETMKPIAPPTEFIEILTPYVRS
jgi:acyl-CoA thioester hydrolase